MGLESATYLTDLVSSNPSGSDNASQGDDHIRLIKSTLQTTLPNASRPKYIPQSGATKTSGFTTANTDDEKIFQCDATSGTLTVVLFTTTIDGLTFYFQKVDSSSNAVVLDPTSTTLINGSTTFSLTKQWQACKVIWLNTYNAWVCLPTINAIPYYSGGQDIPFSDIAPSANAKRLLGAATATDFSEQTIATALEWLGTAARGDIILRGASAFAYLNIGSVGKVLTSDGTDLAYATPAVIQRNYGEYTANASLSTTVPNDDTIPQVGEGTEILSVTITPKSTSNRVRAHFRGTIVASASNAQVAASLFKDGGANAIATSALFMTTIGVYQDITLDFEHAPATTSQITYSIRVGAHTGNVSMNASTVGNRIYGGAQRATLILEEITSATS